jgi:hypothetical protein
MKVGEIFSRLRAILEPKETEPPSEMASPNRVAKTVAPPKNRLRFFGWELIPDNYLDQVLATVSGNKYTHVPTEDNEDASTDAQADDTASIISAGEVDGASLAEEHGEQEKVDEEIKEEQDDEEDDEDEDEDDDEDIYGEVAKWAPLQAISDDRFVSLINRLLQVEDSAPAYKVERRTKGSYHHVVILDNGIQKVAVKVPVVGVESRWNPAHGRILQSEADTMTYIKEKIPKFPIPRVHCYDVGFENEIGAPFLLLSFVDGKASQYIWYRDILVEDADDECNNSPSQDQEQLRVTFLKSLADNMAQLSQLNFDGLGMLVFKDNEPVIGPFHGWKPFSLDELTRRYWEHPVYNTAQEYYSYRIGEQFGTKNDCDLLKGINFIFTNVFNSPPFSSSKQSDPDEKETFTLFHNDLDFQNILVSDSGEVTAILDWDGCGTVPRCVGSVAVPLFLQRDWELNYDPIDPAKLAPWRLAHYRKIYSDALKQACGGSINDAVYTEKSHVYSVAHDVLFGENSMTLYRAKDFATKLMHDIPAFRNIQEIDEFLEKLGAGWPDAEELLKEWIPKLMDWKTE